MDENPIIKEKKVIKVAQRLWMNWKIRRMVTLIGKVTTYRKSCGINYQNNFVPKSFDECIKYDLWRYERVSLFHRAKSLLESYTLMPLERYDFLTFLIAYKRFYDYQDQSICIYYHKLIALLDEYGFDKKQVDNFVSELALVVGPKHI